MATTSRGASTSMRRLSLDDQEKQAPAPAIPSSSDKKPVIVGLYGVSGSGKTTLVEKLKPELEKLHFAFYDGSEVIADLVRGGLDAFKKLPKTEQMYWRERAIEKIEKECTESGKVGVVAGHYILWSEVHQDGKVIGTKKDLDTYTHILYLDVPAVDLFNRRLDDKTRERGDISPIRLDEWQQDEKTQLLPVCRKHEILFLVVHQRPDLVAYVMMLLRDFQIHSEMYNLSKANCHLDQAMSIRQAQLEKMDADKTLAPHDLGDVTKGTPLKTMLVLDADKTLAPDDTGETFWQQKQGKSALNILFGGELQYSYTAFRQATMLYEEAASDEDFDKLCQAIADKVVMYQPVASLLKKGADEKFVGAIVITCGPRRVWEKVLEKEGLRGTVAVIGGGRIADGYVVTPALKAALVARLQVIHRVYVWAFGDGPLDLDMLKKANQAIVIVGEMRSKSMEEKLKIAVDNEGLRAHQVLIPESTPPRLDNFRLPAFQLDDPDFRKLIFNQHKPILGPHAHNETDKNLVGPRIHLLHATEKTSAKLLMTPLRDARIAGSALRKAHGRVGKYLATECLMDLIGVEKFAIPHVQGYATSGYRLLHEKETTIVALMRGGESMALGVSDVFPLAMFVHQDKLDDVELDHLQGQETAVLVDSVVNNGDTLLKAIHHVRKLAPNIRIVVVAWVIQSQALKHPVLVEIRNLSLIALRLSDNKYKGSRATDTGNRLFNTTHMD